MIQPAAYSAIGLSQRWRCSRRTIYKMVDEGRLRKMDLGGKLFRISAAEVARVEGCGSNNTVESIMPSGDRTGKQDANPLEPTIFPQPSAA